jgi:L-threonylcarbamoyladenylate synthase
MMVTPFDNNTPGDTCIRTLGVLKNGGIIAYSTESYYALGVLATDESAVRRLFELKNRSSDKPLPIIIGSSDMLPGIVKEVPNRALVLMEQFWPGPLTIIFKALDVLPALLTGGGRNVAVRIPGDSAALCIAQTLGVPITATSANISSAPPADAPEAVLNYFGNNVDLILDSGKSRGGRPSTIIDVTVDPPVILRQGSVSAEDVLKFIY